MNAPGRPSRRRFLRTLGGGGAAALGGGLLAACAGPALTPAPPRATAADLSRRQRAVSFASWPGYVDTEGSGGRLRHPTLAEFTRRTGIRVDYSEPITGNQQIVGQLGIRLALGRYPGYDLLVLTDWMVAELAGTGWAQPLDASAVPNAARLAPEFRHPPLPRVAGYSLPWQGGFTGIAWNDRVYRRPVTSMAQLLTSPDLRGRVGLVPDMRDVIGLIMLELGTDPAAFTGPQFRAALRRLGQAVAAGQIRVVTSDYVPALTRGEIAACVAWSGDILSVQADSPQLRFALPAAGGMLWTDNMVIPAFARHKLNAERLMNFYYEPAAAAQLSASQLFICPVLGTQALARRTDPALAGQPYVFPGPGLLARAHYFRYLPAGVSAAYTNRYVSMVGL